MATPEDVILSKLEWNAITPSQRQLRDVAGILSTQGDRFDREYMEKWVHELAVADQLHRQLGIME